MHNSSFLRFFFALLFKIFLSNRYGFGMASPWPPVSPLLSPYGSFSPDGKDIMIIIKEGGVGLESNNKSVYFASGIVSK